MNKFLGRELWIAGFLGVAISMAPAFVDAQTETERWNQGQAELEKKLQPGQPADTYQKKIADLGYNITALNYNSPDYLEYEIVKGDQSWEVQIDIDAETHKATAVDVAMNIWKTEATEQVLQRHTSTEVVTSAPTSPAQRRDSQYSDQDHLRTDRLIQELEALPVGRDKQFYRTELTNHGYAIAKVHTDSQDELALEAVKNGQSIAFTVDFDKNTGKSTEVDASTLWAESEATIQTREGQISSSAAMRVKPQTAPHDND